MKTPMVFLVDDDAAVRDGIRLLLETEGWESECHASAESFLEHYQPDRPGCLILDVRMERMSGPELQTELARRGLSIPIIFLTGHGDIPMTVRAVKAGAVDFLTKPVDVPKLIDRVRSALEQQKVLFAQRQRLADLTAREREVMTLMVAGLSSKLIARELGISHRTVEIHRARVLEKTRTGKVLELAQLVVDCGLAPAVGGNGALDG